MEFAISDTHISVVFLVSIGFVIGVLGGFFGVGGSFLAGPALFAAGLPMNFVVGTDLAHIVGKSIVAMKKHHTLGNVDMKLGGLMAIGSIVGVEAGAQLIQHLKKMGNVDLPVGIVFVVVLLVISGFVGYEGWMTKKKQERSGKSALKKDETVFKHVARRIQKFRVWPMVRFRKSEIKEVSLWSVIGVSFIGGIFSGFLGGGAGYIRMPMLVYVLGVPTHIAVGTDLFEVIISAGYGTFTHALKGNVDIMIALVMHTGAAIGAQIGAQMTEYFHGSRIRLAFAPLPLIGAGLVIYGLITGHRL